MDRVEEFNVDDVVIGHSFAQCTEKNGMRATIMEPLQYAQGRDRAGSLIFDYGYMVQWADGETMYVAPRNLRKPPEEFDQSTAQEAADLFSRLKIKFPFERELDTISQKRRVQA